MARSYRLCELEGMDAMAVSRTRPQVGQLWQLPLLVVSIGLFGYAAYLFIDPKALTLSQRLEAAGALIDHDRPEPAIELLNRALESKKLTRADEGRIHLLQASALEKGQKLRHLTIESNYLQIVEQTRLAIATGVAPSADDFRRLAASYEALEKPSDALANYRKAVKLDTTHSLALERKVIDLQRVLNDGNATEESIDQYLNGPHLANMDRAWALDQKADLLIRRGALDEADAALSEAMALDDDATARGVVRYYQACSARARNDSAEAERLLRVARDLLRSSHPLDAEAAYMLGRIRQEANDPREAIGFYDAVLLGHPESRPAPLARLGRGQCRIDLKDNEGGLADLNDVVKFVTAKPSRSIYKAEVVAGLKQASAVLVGQGNYEEAMEAMAAEETFFAEPTAEFLARLASVYEKRADQVEQANADPAPKAGSTVIKPISPAERVAQVEKLRTQAGDTYVALSRKLTLSDDRSSGQALWKGVDLYDRAGAIPETIAALEQFIGDRPEDGQAPEALLRLGRAYQARGQFDQAIAAFLRNQFRYPQSLAASKSGVPLAQAYIANGPQFYAKAEKVLLAVVENNAVLTPDAQEFRQALFEMAQLYYRTGRFEDAVSRLEELTQRYPNDQQGGQLLFLIADSYRKSAELLVSAKSKPAGDAVGAAAPTTAPADTQLADPAEIAAARTSRLEKARSYFDRAINLYEQSPPKTETDALDLKLSCFYTADCVYDLGRYEEAIKLYSSATQRYQKDPISLSGYVQIINAYNALGKPKDAEAANERAKWLLRQMPSEAFEKNKMSVPRAYWDDWLKATSESDSLAKR